MIADGGIARTTAQSKNTPGERPTPSRKPDQSGRRRLTFTVRPVSFIHPIVLSPETPVLVDRLTQLTTVGKDGHFAKLERNARDEYTVTALVPAGTGDGGADPSNLRDAGTAYPPEVVSLYTALSPRIMGPNLTLLRDEVVRTAASSAPYDLALRTEEILRSSPFQYDTDLRDIDCGSLSIAECFATSHRGFCVQFAVTMAVLLRDLDVPARVVMGFMPGSLDAESGIEVIRNSDAHAWVEVYFPGYGWFTFDPTAGFR